MSDAANTPRRNWFRLLSQQTATAPDAQPQYSAGSAQKSLTPIAPPINHDGLDLSQLPPMREGLLSVDQVRNLFVDVEELTTEVVLMRRTAQSPRAAASRADSSADLHQARDALLSGQVARLQIRYHFQGADWIDTLEARADEFRLVRIAHQSNRSPRPEH